MCQSVQRLLPNGDELKRRKGMTGVFFATVIGLPNPHHNTAVQYEQRWDVINLSTQPVEE